MKDCRFVHEDFPLTQDFLFIDNFPTLEMFSNAEAKPWREVPGKTVFEIVDMRMTVTKTGEGMLLTLRERDGSTITAWATKLIKECLETSFKNTDSLKFIVNFRKKISTKNNEYYDFKIITR